MFKNDKNVSEKINKAVKYFSNYEEHLMHSRPLSIEKISNLDLKIEAADKNLADLLWEAHILINGFFNIASVVKLYENTNDITWARGSKALDDHLINSRKKEANLRPPK